MTDEIDPSDALKAAGDMINPEDLPLVGETASGMPLVPAPPANLGTGFPGANGPTASDPPMAMGTPTPPTADAPRSAASMVGDGSSSSATELAPGKKKLDLAAFIWPVLVLAVAAFALYSCASAGTSADSLKVGDCFEIPAEEFNSVETQPCDGPHEAQIYAEINTVLGADCVTELIGLEELDFDRLPRDWDVREIGAADDPGTVQCVLISDSAGLVASIVG